VAAVLGIAFTPHPPLNTDEKCCQKAELGLAECNFQNSEKSFWPMVCALNHCFCCQKAEMNFTQSIVFAECNFKIRTKNIRPMVCILNNCSSALPAAVMKPV